MYMYMCVCVGVYIYVYEYMYIYIYILSNLFCSRRATAGPTKSMLLMRPRWRVKMRTLWIQTTWRLTRRLKSLGLTHTG